MIRKIAAVTVLASFGLWGILAPLHDAYAAPAARKSGKSAKPAKPRQDDIDFLVAYLRRNYAGWEEKVGSDPKKEKEFLEHVENQRKLRGKKEVEPLIALHNITAWLKDRHTGVQPVPQQTIAAAPKVPEKAAPGQNAAAKIDVDALDARLSAKDGQDPWKGIWESVDGRYCVAVEPTSSGEWRALVLSTQAGEWRPGETKFTVTKGDDAFTSHYAMGDHSMKALNAKLAANGDVIVMEDGETTTVWKRRNSTMAQEWLDRRYGSSEFFLKPISDKTLWLRLPDFFPSNRERIEKLLSDNKTLLDATPNLLIDLRNNGGGSDSSYSKLMELVCSRAVYIPQIQFRTGAENARAHQALLSDVEGLSEGDRKELLNLARKVRETKGEWFMSNERGFSVQKCDNPAKTPVNVGVIITGAGSSGEQFVLDVRQSHKVTLFGGNTLGVIDYSNVRYVTMPSGKFRLFYATSKSLRLPEEVIDGVGIAPDVRLDNGDLDQIEFVRGWLERRTDAAPAPGL